MKRQSSILLLSFFVLAASCSKSNYAQVEPDDLYFTHKDRKAAVEQTIVPSSPMITTVEPVQTPTEYNRTDYSNQHSPVLVTPSYGSPTIQQYGQQPEQPYYDTSVNPDYLYDEQYTELESTSAEYYDEAYAYQAPPAYQTPQVNNYYYNQPNSSYFPSSAWMGGVYYSSFSSFRPSRMYRYGMPSMMYDPFTGYSSRYFNSYDPYFSTWNNSYSNWGNPYCGYVSTILPANYHEDNYPSNNYYIGGTGGTYNPPGPKVVTKPRKSRSQVSSEVDKSNLPISTRRADYVSRTSEAGRVATKANGRTTGKRTAEQSNYTRRGNSYTYQSGKGERASGQMEKRQQPTLTVEKRNPARNNGNRTVVVVPTRTRTSTVNRNNTGQRNSNPQKYGANRSSVNRTSTPTRSSGGSRYSNSANSNRNSSYGTRSSNGRSSTGYSRSSSSGTKSRTYTPAKSSSRSSYKAPSRSSGSSSRSGYTPSRSSSSSRSSGTRSSGSSSRSSSSRKKN